jgi:hypothetical protein
LKFRIDVGGGAMGTSYFILIRIYKWVIIYLVKISLTFEKLKFIAKEEKKN